MASLFSASLDRHGWRIDEWSGGFIMALGDEGNNSTYCPICGLDWVICGGETGPKARPMHPDWVRSLRDQCSAAGIPFFFKGWGEFSPSEIEHSASGAVNKTGGKFHYIFDKTCNGNMRKLGKKYRLLDGVEHSEVPA